MIRAIRRQVARARLAYDLLREYEREQAQPPLDVVAMLARIQAYAARSDYAQGIRHGSQWAQAARDKACVYGSVRS